MIAITVKGNNVFSITISCLYLLISGKVKAIIKKPIRNLSIFKHMEYDVLISLKYKLSKTCKLLNPGKYACQVVRMQEC